MVLQSKNCIANLSYAIYHYKIFGKNFSEIMKIATLNYIIFLHTIISLIILHINSIKDIKIVSKLFYILFWYILI